MMLQGKSVFGGIAIGKLAVYRKRDSQVKRVKISDAEAEICRFEAARELAKEQLGALYEKALKEVGEVNAMIFEVHQMPNLRRQRPVIISRRCLRRWRTTICGSARRMCGISRIAWSPFCRGLQRAGLPVTNR